MRETGRVLHHPPQPFPQLHVVRWGHRGDHRRGRRGIFRGPEAPSAGIKQKDLYGIADRFGNVLENVTIPAYPVIQEIKDLMLEQGAIGALMSGSGPTVFGLFTNPKAAAKAHEEMRFGAGAELAKQVYLTNFYNPRG